MEEDGDLEDICESMMEYLRFKQVSLLELTNIIIHKEPLFGKNNVDVVSLDLNDTGKKVIGMLQGISNRALAMDQAVINYMVKQANKPLDSKGISRYLGIFRRSIGVKQFIGEDYIEKEDFDEFDNDIIMETNEMHHEMRREIVAKCKKELFEDD